MTYQEAVSEMKVLAEGGTWSLVYEVSSYFDGPQIHGYIASVPPYHAETAPTYAGAIENVKMMLGLLGSDPAPEDEEKDLPFSDAVILAKGCHDYGGGHHEPKEIQAYHHGIDTVIRVLEEAKINAGEWDMQLKTVYSVGKNTDGIPPLSPITTPVRELDPAVIEKKAVMRYKAYQNETGRE